jgi:hypothetical protein
VTAGILWGVIAAIGGICVGYAVYSVAAFAVLVRCSHRLTPDELAVEDESDTVVPIEADNQNGPLPAPIVFETVEPV